MDEIVDQKMRAGTRRLTYIVLVFPIVLIGAGFLLRQLQLGWIGMAIFVVVAMGSTVMLVRATQARAQALGCASPAMLRYNWRMIVCSMAYMAIFLFAVFAFKQWQLRGPLLWAAALASALPILGMIWAMARLLIEETDEYLRSRIVHQALFGTGTLLVVATVWGFLEQFALVPHVPSWAVIPVFAIGLGLSHLVRGARA